MSRRARRIRGMVLWNYISSTAAIFLVFMLMIVMFGFDLEDDIFDYQVEQALDKLTSEQWPPATASGTVESLEMQYYVGLSAMPDWLRDEIEPTWRNRSFEIFAEQRGHFHAYVRTLENGEPLYILFNARPFVRSTPQIMGYLVIVGSLAGLVLLISLFFLLRMTHRVSAPLEGMAKSLSVGKEAPSRLAVPASAPAELHALAQAIEDRDERISRLLEREREFNRDASHELRTPLAVAYGALEVLEEGGIQNNALGRLKTAVKDMQLLTEGILWLGRDPARAQGCDLAAVCQQCIKSYAHLVGDRNVVVRLEQHGAANMPVPEAVAQVMIGNILRNAMSYTDEGEVVLQVRDGTVTVTDTGAGYGYVDADKEGFGVGLTLVTRLCHHFGLTFHVSSQSSGGSKAELTWSNIMPV